MTYRRESDLCADFMDAVRETEEWTPYPETGGFDILLSHDATGIQVGIEAKLRLNAKVACQVLPWRHDRGEQGPDFRAVLVPTGKTTDVASLCHALGIQVLMYDAEMRKPKRNPWRASAVDDLPVKRKRRNGEGWYISELWTDWCPSARLPLPEYVPDVAAGARAPRQLSAWKIKAIKLQIVLKERPVTRADFRALDLSPTMWLDPHYGWLVKDAEQGGYVPRDGMPDLREQLPKNYDEIEADKAKWMAKLPEFRPVGAQQALFQDGEN